LPSKRDLEASTKARFEATPKNGKARRFKEFLDGAASWSRVERIIARVEAGADGTDTRFIVTNLDTRSRAICKTSMPARAPFIFGNMTIYRLRDWYGDMGASA
jgi:hypothetical protein